MMEDIGDVTRDDDNDRRELLYAHITQDCIPPQTQARRSHFSLHPACCDSRRLPMSFLRVFPLLSFRSFFHFAFRPITIPTQPFLTSSHTHTPPSRAL